MNPNPFAMMLRSRKFWTFFVTAASNLVIYFATKYLAPSAVEDVKTVLGFIDGIAAIYIGSIAWEDGKRLDNPTTTQTVTAGINPQVTTTNVTAKDTTP